MTTFPFTPQANANFNFQPTFDGQQYTVTCTWNLFGQRYYVNILTLNGQLIVSTPLIGSPDNFNISLTAGYFTSTLVYRVSTGNFEVSP